MIDILVNPTFWHWLVLACVLLGIEILAPGAFFLWLSIAAATSAFIAFLVPTLSWAIQYTLFAIFCVVSLILWKRFARVDTETDQPQLNQRNQQYVGRTIALSEAIQNGVGKVRIDDSLWKVSGTDAAVGTQVKVIGVDGSTLLVETL